MSDSGTWVEILLLAMLAGFIGLRLVSVLGKRTGHEKPVPDRFAAAQPEVVVARPGIVETRPRTMVTLPMGTDAALLPDLQKLADIDTGFDPAKFLTGAQAAYRMVLEAFWSGDAAAMDGLVSDEVLHQFRRAIEQRGGAALPNRLASVDSATISHAQLIGQMAEVTVHFDARIAAGSNAEAANRDVWTFSRHIGSADPAWLLIATDAEA